MFDNVKAGKQIALLRKNKGLTQEDVARELNISPQAVSKWENGHTMPELSVLVELTELLGCTIDQILFPMPVPAPGANFEQTLPPQHVQARRTVGHQAFHGIGRTQGHDEPTDK